MSSKAAAAPTSTPLAEARRPTAIDLFSGAGGLSLGFESAGYDVLSAVEYDAVHAATHLFNFPLTDMLVRDIAEVGGDELLESARRGWALHYPNREWDGVVDAIIGGPSCQGFSAMGHQRVDDERNLLILQFVRLVEEIRPTTFCLENVPGLLDSRFDSIRNEALARLREAGYAISGESEIVRAEDFGVPQKRRRVLIMGMLGDTAPSRPVKRSGEPFTVGDAFAGLPQLARYSKLDTTDVVTLSTAAAATLRGSMTDYLRDSDILEPGPDHRGHHRELVERELSGCRLTTHSDETAERFAATVPGTKEKVSRFYRLSQNSTALTLRAGTGRERGSFSAARPVHPRLPRVITVREAARLHSFPDWFRFHTTNWHGHRQIGNAVPPLLARAAASALLTSAGLTPVASTLDAIPTADRTLLEMTPRAAAVRFGVDEQVPQRIRRADAA